MHPNAPGPHDYRPLQFAARSGSWACVEVLVCADAEINAQDRRFLMAEDCRHVESNGCIHAHKVHMGTKIYWKFDKNMR